MPAWIVGDLDVGDARRRRLEPARKVPLHDLHVIDVGLQIEIVRLDAADQPQRFVGAIEIEARHVAIVDRFDQQLDAAPFRHVRREGEILEKYRLEDPSIDIRRRDPREAIEPLAAERLGVVERAPEPVAKLVFASRENGEPALARRPVAGGQVEQRLRQSMVGEAAGDVLWVVLVGRHIFDALESDIGGGGEAVEKGLVREEKAEVCGKSGHAASGRDRVAPEP